MRLPGTGRDDPPPPPPPPPPSITASVDEQVMPSPSLALASSAASTMGNNNGVPLPPILNRKEMDKRTPHVSGDAALNSPSSFAAENETVDRCSRVATEMVRTAAGQERPSPSGTAESETGCFRIVTEMDITGGLERHSPTVAAAEAVAAEHEAGTGTSLKRPSASVPAEKVTAGRSHVDAAAKTGTERSHVAAETAEHRRPRSNSVLQGPRRVAHLGPEEKPVSYGVRGFKTSPARLQRRRRNTTLEEGESSSRVQIKNTATICLDGADGKDVLPSYSAGITSIVEWCRANGMTEDVSHLFGPEVVQVFTTPLDGTYYLVLEYDNRSLELVISGRDLYMMGWRGLNGTYEIKSDSQAVNYMAGNDVIVVAARRNYQRISPDGEVGRTKMGIHEFRRAFEDLYNYSRGESPRKIEEAIGKIAVYISEATRLQGAFDTVCASLKSKEVSRLDKGSFNCLWINRYRHYSTQAMQQIDLRKRRQKAEPIKIRGIEIQNVEEILREIRVLHVDAYNVGIFQKKKPRPKVFLEERKKSTSHNEQYRSWRAVEKSRNAKNTAPSKDRRPSRRGYTTSTFSDSICAQVPPVKDEYVVEHCNGLTALKKQGDQVSEYMQHFPALQRLCKQNYESKTQMQVRQSLKRSFNSGQGTQCLPELTDKPKRRLQMWDLISTPSRHSTPPSFLHRPATSKVAPALQRLCKQNYESKTQMQVRQSLKRSFNSGQGTQCLPELTDKPKRRLQMWDLISTPSRHSTPPSFLHRPATNKVALVQAGTPKTKYIASRKDQYIQLASGFISKLLRHVRR